MKLSMKAVAVVLAVSFLAVGCAKKAEPNKPIAQVQAEAEKMSAKDLQKTAQAYADAIKAKKADMQKVQDKLRSLPPKELFSEKSKSIREEVTSVSKDLGALAQRYSIYTKKFTEKGGDLSKIKTS